MFRTVFQLLVVSVLGLLAYEYMAGDKVQSWSYCGKGLKQEKFRMEKEVRQMMKELGENAEVTWKEDAKCISATVKNSKQLTSFLMGKLKERF